MVARGLPQAKSISMRCSPSRRKLPDRLPPIHTLPADTLIEIFLLCLPQSQCASIDNRNAPISLTMVCRSWRMIATNRSELWSTIRVSHKLSVASVPIIKIWLNRSKDRPLTFRLPPEDHPDSHKFLNCFFPHAPRWADAHLQISQETFALLLRRLVRARTHLKQLVSLDLQITNESKHDFSAKLSAFLSLAPRLRYLCVADAGLPSSLLSIPSSSVLTDLFLDMALGPRQALHILKFATALRECTFANLVRFELEHSSVPIYHPHLTSLSICTSQHLSFFFEMLTLPSLQSISIEYGGENWEGEVSFPFEFPSFHYTQMLQRSHCHLESFKLRNSGISATSLIPCLEPAQQHLRVLEVCGQGNIKSINRAVIELLTCDPRNPVGNYPVFCPRLEEITFRECVSCAVGDFASLVTSRSQITPPAGLAPLRRILVFGAHTEDYRILRRLQLDGKIRHDVQFDIRSF
ncbi:hypothetical protein HGRIS_004995 [Hohenbuehelia grisea]|uniref:F-box domain-containing protein n=1 Tax=Hohenbuehelia grisea TaxID=104357 RepID=A0ABR3JF99_9AGAR